MQQERNLIKFAYKNDDFIARVNLYVTTRISFRIGIIYSLAAINNN